MTEKAEHTLGSWTVDDGTGSRGAPIITGGGHRVAKVLYWSGSEDVTEVEANARLIAEAPETKEQRDDLLEALAGLVSALNMARTTRVAVGPHGDEDVYYSRADFGDAFNTACAVLQVVKENIHA